MAGGTKVELVVTQTAQVSPADPTAFVSVPVVVGLRQAAALLESVMAS